MAAIESAITEDERARILNLVIAQYAREGWTISGVSVGQAIAQTKEPLGGTNFWFNGIFWFANILLVLFTGGLWLIAILIMYLTRRTETVVIGVDEAGHVSRS